MGINGLLRNLHPLLVPPPTHHTNRNNNNNGTAHSIKIRHNIQQFAHKSLAIDASSWLYKSAYTCSELLVESTENGIRDPIAESKYTSYMISRCKELLSKAKISQLYLVFDGIRVPLKADTNAEREHKRHVNLAEARRLSAMGRREEAKERYNKCVKGTEEMARVVCAEVERVFGRGEGAKVQCVFSPYEADAQLAKLCVDGICHAVVTEDSDVLVYSASCRRPFPIIYKLDRKDGSCDVVTMDWLLNPKFLPPSRRNRRRRDDSDSESDSDEEDNNLAEEHANEMNNNAELHASEVDYGDDDNMMYAPIRRTLPLPLGNVSASKSNSRARRTTSTKENQTGAAFLATLRSFAHKEANEPGAGCRLFIQACVFSGCDYVPNRLSKVGPITAFKMMRDSSHRKHGERFDRVMKSLPRGSILQNDSTDNTNNLDEDEEDDGGDFLSSCGSYNDMKEKYLDLLTKSEAIFYYHLVKEHASGTIMPLVPHKDPDSPDTSAHLSPSIVSFNSDLSFIGSIEEAMKNKPTAAPPCPRIKPALGQPETNNGWISAKRPAGNVKNAYKKPSLTHPKNNDENRGPQKGTLHYAFSHPNNGPKSKPAAAHQSSSFDKFQFTTQQQSASAATSFGYTSISGGKSNPSGTTPKVSSKAVLEKKSPARSPFFSPMGRMNNFDYTEEPSARKDVKPKRGNTEHTAENNAQHEASSNNESVHSNQVPSSPAKPINDENTFDYEIIVESPPIKTGETRYSQYFAQTSLRRSPRRVSTSPSYKPYAHDEGCSPDHAIDLSDEPESPRKPSNNAPSLSQTSNLSKSSVNKRPFKSPYPNLNDDQIAARKKPRQGSSGALLAGFGIPRDPATGKPLSARQRLAARNAHNKKLKAKANPIQNYMKQK